MTRFLRDLRQSARALARRPGVALAVVGTLGAAIGLCTAIFSVVDGLLLKSLPFPDADRIALVREVAASGQQLGFSEPNFDDLAARVQSFADVASSLGSVSLVVTGGSEPVRARVSFVSARFFDVLRVYPAAGRTFSAEETRPRGRPAVVVSHAFWQRLLGGRADFAGLRLKVDGIDAAVVGVMPPGFTYPTEAEVWLTSTAEPRNPVRTTHGLAVIGRLRDGVDSRQAQAELTSIATTLRAAHGAATDAVDFALVDVQAYLTRNVREALWLLLGAVGLLLVVACANVANLVLARFLGQQRELAVRRALGATRARLARRFTLEQLLLTLPAAALGAVLAALGVRLLLFLEGGVLPRFNPVAVDLRVLGVTAGVAVAISLALGALPASRLRTDVSAAELRAGASSPDAATGRVRAALLVLQVAVTTVLLMCAGVLARGYLSLATADPGFDLRGAVTMTLGLPSNVSVQQDEELRRFYVQLLERVAALPGVRAVGGINALPLSGQGAAGTFVIDDDPMQRGSAIYRVASAGYFPALGVPLMQGRLFEPSDVVDGPHVAVISESLARAAWPGEGAIGRRIQFAGMDGDRRPLNIVGVVADVKTDSLDTAPRPTVYAYSLQRPQWWQVSRLAIVIRTDRDPATLVPALRAEVERLRPDVPLQFRTLREVASASLTQRRFSLVLFGVFAVTALAIAGLGVFAAVSYAVSQRTRELAIRTALGATRGRLVAAVLRQGLAFVAAGLAVGFAGALLATRLIANLVYGARVVDVATFAVVALLLLAVALAASWLPARRASGVDPMAAIRGD